MEARRDADKFSSEVQDSSLTHKARLLSALLGIRAELRALGTEIDYALGITTAAIGNRS